MLGPATLVARETFHAKRLEWTPTLRPTRDPFFCDTSYLRAPRIQVSAAVQ